MKVFLDSSALVKLYHEEGESETVQNMLSQNAESLFLSDLAKLEFRSAMWKKVRTGELTEDLAKSVISLFQNDYSSFQWIEMRKEIFGNASQLLMKYGAKGLRTLDSIQLASAISIKSNDCHCLTFDDLLNDFFKKEGLTTF